MVRHRLIEFKSFFIVPVKNKIVIYEQIISIVRSKPLFKLIEIADKKKEIIEWRKDPEDPRIQ
jgi:hypothetical protein